MWVFDWETLRFLAVNDAALVQYGDSREQFLTMKVTDFRTEDAESPGGIHSRLTGGPKRGVCRATSAVFSRTIFASRPSQERKDSENRDARLTALSDITGANWPRTKNFIAQNLYQR